MSVSTHEDVAVELSLHGRECFDVTPGEHLMPMDDTNLEVADLNNFGLWQSWVIIEVTFHDVCLTLCSCKVFLLC